MDVGGRQLASFFCAGTYTGGSAGQSKKPRWGRGGLVGRYAQDPLKTGTKTIVLKLENEKVRVLIRVLDWDSKPGDKDTDPISIPIWLFYYVTTGSYTSTAPDGKSSVVNVKAGDTVFKKAFTHSVENTGNTEVEAILVEFSLSDGSMSSRRLGFPFRKVLYWMSDN